jgi:DnaJ-class molecular chaperone
VSDQPRWFSGRFQKRCERCLGSGMVASFSVEDMGGDLCSRCGGSGIDPTDKSLNGMAPEEAELLDASIRLGRASMPCARKAT